MSTTIFAIRPEPGLSATIAAARALGLAIEGHPLSDVVPAPWEAPPDTSFDALLLGSANAVRHAGSALARWRGRPAHAVGEATARAAREAGLAVDMVGEGRLQGVIDRLAARGPLRLLRLVGEKHTAIARPPEIIIDTRVVYRLVHRAISPAFAARLADGGIVMLHSAEAARHFVRECDRHGLPRDRLSLAALAPRIARAAGPGWRRVAAAPQPADSALLAMARDMCH